MAPATSSTTGAAIDIGSNSVHLLVADVDDRILRRRRDDSQLLGMGARVDLDGHIGAEDAAAALDVLSGYVAAARDEAADWVILLGTEPLRRAADRSAFARDVASAVGIPLQVLSHDEEALLTVLGVLDGQSAREPTLVLDIGGGSSELVLLEPGADPVVGALPVGSARLTAAYVEDDPPTASEVEAMRAEARHLMASMPVGHPVRGVVVGGSGTNLLHLVAVAGGTTSDPGDRIDRDGTRRAIEVAMSRPSAELARDVGLRERRILQMSAGACLIEAALDCYGLERMEASEASLREGAILARARAGEGWREHLAALVGGA